MSILQKLSSLTRGTAREAAQGVIDRNAHRIMDQEIVDIERSILMHKNTLAELMASRKQLARESDVVKSLIEKREDQARRLINEERDAELIEDIVKEIADQEVILESLGQARSDTERRILKLEARLNKSVLEIANYRRELRIYKAQLVQGDVGSVGNMGLSQKFSDLKATHDRLIALRDHQEDRDEAWHEMESKMESGSIDSRLDGLKQTDHQLRAQGILARLKDASEKSS